MGFDVSIKDEQTYMVCFCSELGSLAFGKRDCHSTVGEVRRMHPEMPKQWPLILRLEWRWGGKVL